MIRTFVLLLTCLLSTIIAETKSVKLFIPPIQSQEIDDENTILITNRLKLEIEKKQFIELTEIKNTSASNDTLSDTISGIDSLINIAEKTNAENLLYTTISKFGKLWTISSKLISVKDGAVLHTITEDLSGTDEEFFVKGPAEVAVKLSTFLELGRKISVSITTIPDSAILYVNDKEVGFSPYQKETRKEGIYSIKLEKYGYDDVFDTIILVAGTEVIKKYELNRSQAWLDSVESARNDSIIQVAKKSMKNTLPEALTQLTIPLTGDATDNRIAVIPFETTDSLKDAAKMSSEYAVSYFSAQPEITLVDRENFQKVIKEIELSYSGIMSDETALEAGNMLTANYIVTGTVNSFNNNETVFMRLIDVETNKIVTASSAQLKEELVEQMNIDVFGERIQPSSALFRSLVAPGWGQFYTNHPGHGITSIVLVTAGIGASVYLGMDYNDKADAVDKYISKDPSTVLPGDTPASWAARAETLEQERDDAKDLFRYALIGTGVVWIGNVIDATILGIIESKNIKELYFSALPDNEGNMNFSANVTINF